MKVGGIAFGLLALCSFELWVVRDVTVRPVDVAEAQTIVGGSFSFSTTTTSHCTVSLECTGFSGWPFYDCSGLSCLVCPTVTQPATQIGYQSLKTVSTPCTAGTDAANCLTGWVYCYCSTPPIPGACGTYNKRGLEGLYG